MIMGIKQAKFPRRLNSQLKMPLTPVEPDPVLLPDGGAATPLLTIACEGIAAAGKATPKV